MHELPKRLLASPRLTAELTAATVCINLLALADTIYVMIVLRRYIAYGFDGTLFLLTLGALVALGLQWGLTAARRVLAGDVGAGEDMRLAGKVHDALTGASSAALDEVPRERMAQAAADLGDVQASCDSNAVCALLDAPFALMFAAAAYFLSPILAAIVLLGIALSILTGLIGARRSREGAKAFTEAVGENRAVLASASFASDTVRIYQGAPFYRTLFRDSLERVAALKRNSEDMRGLAQALTMGSGVFVRVALYAVGAKLAVEGKLTVAALIGVSILGSYAMAKASGSVQAGLLMARAAESLERLGAILELPKRRSTGLHPHRYDGGLELKDIGFAFGEEQLFKNLTLKLPPGGILVVRGYNGSGKTTFLRLLAGLLDPSVGEIKAGGAPLTEADPAWWRAQLAYVPQEPFFLAGTIRENILLGAPEHNGPDLRDVVRRARLERFLDTSDKGVETMISDAGRTLPVGTRKRLALARALACDGRLVLMDEPTAGMDPEGAQALYDALNAMAREGRTIVVVSGDPNIVKGATMVLDLGVKPVPEVATTKGPEGGVQ